MKSLLMLKKCILVLVTLSGGGVISACGGGGQGSTTLLSGSSSVGPMSDTTNISNGIYQPSNPTITNSSITSTTLYKDTVLTPVKPIFVGDPGGGIPTPIIPVPVPVPTPVPTQPKPAGTITQVTVQNTSLIDQLNVPITFGHIFAQGDVPASNTVTGQTSDGISLPLQLDAKATHADGSLRHGIISAVLPKLTAGQIQTIYLIKSGQNSAQQTGLPPTALTNAGFTASVKITLAGQVYAASADALLKGSTYKTWIAGPLANEWLVSVPLTTAQGVAHPHLSARFAVRSYTGLNKAKVDVVLENDWAYEPAPQDFTYDAAVTVGGQIVYSKAALNHYHHARWRKTFWWGGEPQTHIKHNTAYLIASKAVPNYDQSVVISPSAIVDLKNRMAGAAAEPMGNGLAMPSMPTTGGRPDIGLLPGWAVSYLLSMDKDAKDATLKTADLAGSWSAHYRNRNTDRPASLVDFPYMTILGHFGDTFNPVTKKYEAFPACGGDCSNPNQAEESHEPSFAYLPYIVTGDYYYLEELHFWAMWNLFLSNPGYRDNVNGLFHRDQVRGQAWILRTLADAAYITPDNDPFKPQFDKFLSNNLDWYNSIYTNNPARDNKLGILTEYAIQYNGDLGMSPWQDDFFTSAAGHVAELGYAKAKPLLAWKAIFPISRMTDPGFCWIFGSIYALNIRDTATGPIYATMGQAYLASNPATLTSLACNSTAMASSLNQKVGEMVGYAYDNAGFPSNMQPALAYSADSGITNGAKAWAVFSNRSVKPDYSAGPQFAIIPR